MPDPAIVTVTLNPAVDRVLEVPRFVAGQNARARDLGSYPAGKGINVARTLAALGTPCIATGFIGEHERRWFEASLGAIGDGLVHARLLAVPGRTRQNITIRDPVLGTETHIREQGLPVGPEDVHRICDDIAALAHDGTIMVFTGSLPAGFPLAHYRDLIKRCRANRARIVIDAADEVAASLRDEQLWMVKLNSAELATFTERPTATRDQCIDAARACCSAHGGHVEIVIATRGADGAIMIGPETEIACRVSLNQERLATTIGCGDALLAGLLHEWLRAERWDHALRRGVAVATAVAVGRSPGTFSLEDAKAFWTHATIEPLA